MKETQFTCADSDCDAPGAEGYLGSDSSLPTRWPQDELKVWWLATVRRGGRLPSVEDLDRKLLEKERFGL